MTSLPDITIIDVAERALRAFGGETLAREQAAMLLTMWRYRPTDRGRHVDRATRFSPGERR